MRVQAVNVLPILSTALFPQPPHPKLVGETKLGVYSVVVAHLLLENCKKSCSGLPADSCSEVGSCLAVQQLPTWLQPQLSAGGPDPAGPLGPPGGSMGGRRTGGLTQHRGQPPPHPPEGT